MLYINNIRNVIFDLDGTLSNTAKATEKAFQIAASEFDVLPPTYEAIEMAMGLVSPQFYKELYMDSDNDFLVNFSTVVDNEEFLEISRTGEAILFSGVADMLKVLHKMGIKMYIASTGNEAHVMNILESTKLRQLFKSIHYGQPDKRNMVAAIIGSEDKDSFIMVGDKNIDADAAKYNSITSIAAGYGYARENEYKLFDIVAMTVSDLLSVILYNTKPKKEWRE